jgi:hypothetical protein
VGRVCIVVTLSEEAKLHREIVEDLKVQWKQLWRERVNDRWLAEGIANQTFPSLFVDKGTVIRATRDYKALSFREILEMQKLPNVERYIPPDPAVGGWTKFVKTHITAGKKKTALRHEPVEPDFKAAQQQLKKGGRGWLHK